MDFATLVGKPVGGSFAPMLYFVLPNTGIIMTWESLYLTDQYGRSLEEFPTIPHYFNRPGLDALETTLQLIADGKYPSYKTEDGL